MIQHNRISITLPIPEAMKVTKTIVGSTGDLEIHGLLGPQKMNIISPVPPTAKMAQEVFKEVPGFPGYSISNLGNVKNNETGRVLKAATNSRGYLLARLYENGKVNTFQIHRLVGLVFIENPEGKPQIDHIDNDKTNNCVENLRWATSSENCANRKAIGKLGLRGVCIDKKKFKAAIKKDGKYKYLGTFNTAEEASAAYETAAAELHGGFANIVAK
jgi:hypothetical protein